MHMPKGVFRLAVCQNRCGQSDSVIRALIGSAIYFEGIELLLIVSDGQVLKVLLLLIF